MFPRLDKIKDAKDDSHHIGVLIAELKVELAKDSNRWRQKHIIPQGIDVINDLVVKLRALI
eukprot:3419960-Prymnesium_polylepis.1